MDDAQTDAPKVNQAAIIELNEKIKRWGQRLHMLSHDDRMLVCELVKRAALASPRATGSDAKVVAKLAHCLRLALPWVKGQDAVTFTQGAADALTMKICAALDAYAFDHPEFDEEASPSLASATAGVNICARCEGRGWITVHESTGQTSRVSNAKCPECHGLQLVPVSPDTTSPWRPIETAPRDGTHILVTVLDKGGFGYCGGKRQDWCAVVHYWPHEGEEGFYLSTGATGFDDRPMDCTHWIPLGSPAASPPVPASPSPREDK